MKWPWSKKNTTSKTVKVSSSDGSIDCVPCMMIENSTDMIHTVFDQDAIGVNECTATIMNNEGIGKHHLALFAVSGEKNIEVVKKFVERLMESGDEIIVSTACLHEDHFLCNEEDSQVRRVDGGRVCECPCHKKESRSDE